MKVMSMEFTLKMFPLEDFFPHEFYWLKNLFNLNLINISTPSIGRLIAPRIFKLFSILVLFIQKFFMVN